MIPAKVATAAGGGAEGCGGRELWTDGDWVARIWAFCYI